LNRLLEGRLICHLTFLTLSGFQWRSKICLPARRPFPDFLLFLALFLPREFFAYLTSLPPALLGFFFFVPPPPRRDPFVDLIQFPTKPPGRVRNPGWSGFCPFFLQVSRFFARISRAKASAGVGDPSLPPPLCIGRNSKTLFFAGPPLKMACLKGYCFTSILPPSEFPPLDVSRHVRDRQISPGTTFDGWVFPLPIQSPSIVIS